MIDYKTTLSKIITDRAYLSEQRLNTIFECKYNRQAINFLIDTETTCDIELIGQDFSSWNKKSKVNKYSVTLKNKKNSYTFDFWDSVNNTEKKISSKYRFYNVLACLSCYAPESFDDFCSDFGYEFKNETEYISAKKIHLDCLAQDKNLRKLFTTEQMEKLQEIN